MASTSSYRGLRASTSADTSVQWKYDVFLSFRGEDTRKKFTDHLYDKLKLRGIKTFRDDPDLERGSAISPELLAAIEQSNLAVIVLSPNYASSKWCLLELAKIVQCMGTRGTILPVFYEVDPSEVRNQTGSFGKAFDQFVDDSREVQEWRAALAKVSTLAGWTSKDYRYETDLIKEIVEALLNKVYPTFTSSESESLQNLVGIDFKIMEIENLWLTEADDVCFIGIWGMGGIGKTTLAKQVHRLMSRHFEVAIFVLDVRHVCTTHGLVHLQEKLLCQILKEKNIQVQNVNDGVARLKRCLSNKKVLLVLDDVNQSDQLESLAGEKYWFGSGSIVIITTRDQRLLVSHGIEKRYKSKGLNEYESLQLFSWKAFKKDYPEEGYMELSKSILDYSRGLPLALIILGSFLYKRDRGDWESTVANLKKAPIDQVLFKVLRISYDGLDNMSQQVFLDVACFLKGNDKERVVEILDSCFGFDTRIMISVLIEKSLLTIFDNRVDMHDLIQEMAREIVRLESEQEPGKRSQLWLRDDIFHVLKENTGAEAVRSIAICLPQVERLAWNPNAFSSMSKLKFLRIQNLALWPSPKYLPEGLRVLEWTSFPSNSLPLSFQPVDLLELILHHSKLHHLWHGLKYFNKLTIMDLSHSYNLTKTPDFTGSPNLERLIFEGCTNLVYVHPSITSLRRLKILNFRNCPSIKRFPGELEMESLELIDLSGCSKVTMIQKFVRNIQNLSDLHFSGTCIQEVSCSIFSHLCPHRLSLVLASLKYFRSLKNLHLHDCKLGEGAIPDEFGCLASLEHLDLSANNFVSLPSSISQLQKLQCLNLADCKRLEQFPCLPSFSGTCDVTANNCISLNKFLELPELCRLWKLSFNFINCCRIKDGGNQDKAVGNSIRKGCDVLTVEDDCEDEIEDDREDEIDEDNVKAYRGRRKGYTGPVTFKNDREDETLAHYVDHGGVRHYGSTDYIIYSILQRFFQEPPPFFETFSTVIPGNNIPGWFKNLNKGGSVRQTQQDCYWCRSKWIGFALCVLFGAEENPGGVAEDYAGTISCDWEPGLFLPAGFSFKLNHIVQSDHLCVFLLPSKHYPENTGSLDPEFIDFRFYSDTGLRMKKCAVRTMYKQDVKEVEFSELRMDQYSRMVQEPSHVLDMFGFVIPGNKIPVWFNGRGKGASLRQERPCISCRNTWLGFTICVLFGAEKISGEIPSYVLSEELDIGANKIWCSWKAKHFSPASYSCSVKSSDHLCVLFIPGDKFLRLPRLVDFEFKTASSRIDVYLEVKGSGVRCLYKHNLPRNMANASLREQLLWSINNCMSSSCGPDDWE